MSNWLTTWLRDTAGQDLIEYLLIGAFVAVAALAGSSSLGLSVGGWFTAVSTVIGEPEESGEEGSGGGGEEGGGGGGGGPKKSNCSARGMVASGGKCHGG